jgi:hypothetical protein
MMPIRFATLHNTGCLKSLEPMAKILRDRITEACAAVHPDILKRILRNMVHRLRKCVGVGGGHVEHIWSQQ